MPKNGEKPARSGLTLYFSASSQNRSCSSLTLSGWLAARSLAWEQSSGRTYSSTGSASGSHTPGGERLEHLGIQAPRHAGHPHGQPPAVLVHRPVAEVLEVLLRVALGGAGIRERLGERHAGHRLLLDAVDMRRLG